MIPAGVIGTIFVSQYLLTSSVYFDEYDGEVYEKQWNWFCIRLFLIAIGEVSYGLGFRCFFMIDFIVYLYLLRIWFDWVIIFWFWDFFIRLDLFSQSKSALSSKKLYPLSQIMINYFLQEQPKVSPEVKQLVPNKLSKPRKYQPFHIDCEYTKKKICYCVNNPVLNIEMDPKLKEKIWKKY